MTYDWLEVGPLASGEPVTFRVFREGDLWVSECAEHDLVAQGKTPTEAFESLCVTAAANAVIAAHEGH